MLARTDTEAAPWTLVAGDSKRFARVEVMRSGHRGDRGRLPRARLPLPAPL